jgi:uncharacterized SAM-binding protein YcdF (DUF218 family)
MKSNSIKKALDLFYRIFNKIIFLLGWVLFIALVFSFTDVPFFAYYWLGTHNSELSKKPSYIVLLGGVGMPSPEDLMRTYFAAGAARELPDAGIVISFPPDTVLHELSPELLMAKELIIRGIVSNRIFFERYGYSTHTQAVNIRKMIGSKRPDTLVLRIVTSPEHMFRAVSVFKKEGFGYVGGSAAFERAIEDEKLIRGSHKKTEKHLLNIRYNMWSYLKYEITVFRECCAIGYYKIRGWM